MPGAEHLRELRLRIAKWTAQYFGRNALEDRRRLGRRRRLPPFREHPRRNRVRRSEGDTVLAHEMIGQLGQCGASFRGPRFESRDVELRVEIGRASCRERVEMSAG